MTKARRNANRLRRLILIVGILYTVTALCWAVLPYFPDMLFDEFEPAGLLWTPLGLYAPDEGGYLIDVALVVGLLLLAQWAFLRPAKAWTARLAVKGRPLTSAVISAAAMGMLLTVGVITLLLELPNLWKTVFKSGWGIAAVWSAMLLLWGAWALIFLVYWRQGDRYTQLGRMIRALVAGSLVEVFVAVPVHVWATRQRECYCERGTYVTLVFAATVLFWAFGPGIILMYMRERYRCARLFPRCTKCGYELRGSAKICPECGYSLATVRSPVPQIPSGPARINR